MTLLRECADEEDALRLCADLPDGTLLRFWPDFQGEPGVYIQGRKRGLPEQRLNSWCVKLELHCGWIGSRGWMVPLRCCARVEEGQGASVKGEKNDE